MPGDRRGRARQRQRGAIIDLLDTVDGLRSAQELKGELRHRSENIGLTTVYRTLQTPAKANLIDMVPPRPANRSTGAAPDADGIDPGLTRDDLAHPGPGGEYQHHQGLQRGVAQSPGREVVAQHHVGHLTTLRQRDGAEHGRVRLLGHGGA